MFIAIGPYAWGKGSTEEDALKNVKRHGGWSKAEVKEIEFIMVEVDDDDAYVDEMGYVTRKCATPSREIARYLNGKRTATV